MPFDPITYSAVKAIGSGKLSSQKIVANGNFTATKTGWHLVTLVGGGAGATPYSGGGAGAGVVRYPVFLTANDVVACTIGAAGVGAIFPGTLATSSPYAVKVDGSNGIYFTEANGGSTRYRRANGGTITTQANIASTPTGPINARLVVAGYRVPCAATLVTTLAKVSDTDFSISNITLSPNLPSCQVVGGDTSGNFYAVSGNNLLYKVTAAGATTLIAGISSSTTCVDGNSGTSTLSTLGITMGTGAPCGNYQLCVNPATGDVFHIGTNGTAIRKTTAAGVTSLLAGDSAYTATGTSDGTGSAARFTNIRALVFNTVDNCIYAWDTTSNNATISIRKITTAGVVTTIKSGLAFNNEATAVADYGIFFDTSGDILIPAGNNGSITYGIQKVKVSDGTVTVPSSDQELKSLNHLRDATNHYFIANGSSATKKGTIYSVPVAGGSATLIGGVVNQPAYPRVSDAATGLFQDGPGNAAATAGGTTSFGTYISVPGGGISMTRGTGASGGTTGIAQTLSTSQTFQVFGTTIYNGAAGTASSGSGASLDVFFGGSGGWGGGAAFLGVGGNLGVAPVSGFGGGGGGGVDNTFTGATAAPTGLANGNGAPGVIIVEW